MKHTRKSARAIALSIRPVATSVLVVVLFALSITMIVLEKNHKAMLEDLRMAVADTVAPALQFLAKPADGVHEINAWVHDVAALHEDNRRLKADNARLLRWQSTALELASENERLKSLLKFAPTTHASYISARVALDAGNPYSHSVVIDAGVNQGVENDSAVVSENGFVGRVMEVGQKTARVLLLTDINSRVPVITQTSREHAIAGGTGADALSLLYLPENSKIKVGETVVTSGDGSVLPPGLPVGVVTKSDKGIATVQTFADWHRLEYVSVVDFTH